MKHLNKVPRSLATVSKCNVGLSGFRDEGEGRDDQDAKLKEFHDHLISRAKLERQDFSYYLGII